MAQQLKKNDKSQFFTVRKLQKSVEELVDTLNDVHERYVQKPMHSGRDFVKDARKNPRKVFNELVDDGKDAMADLRKDTRKKLKDVVADSRSFIQKTRKSPRKAATEIIDDGKNLVKDAKTDIRKKVDTYVDNTREILEGVEKDFRTIADDLVENGRKTIDRIPGKKTAEKTINAFPKQLNLPARNDIEKINRRLEELHRHVESLQAQLAA